MKRARYIKGENHFRSSSNWNKTHLVCYFPQANKNLHKFAEQTFKIQEEKSNLKFYCAFSTRNGKTWYYYNYSNKRKFVFLCFEKNTSTFCLYNFLQLPIFICLSTKWLYSNHALCYSRKFRKVFPLMRNEEDFSCFYALRYIIYSWQIYFSVITWTKHCSRHYHKSSCILWKQLVNIRNEISQASKLLQEKLFVLSMCLQTLATKRRSQWAFIVCIACCIRTNK